MTITVQKEGKSLKAGTEKSTLAMALALAVAVMLGFTFGAVAPPAPSNALQVSSSTHPQGVWVNSNIVKFSWAAVDGATKYYYTLDTNPHTIPDGSNYSLVTNVTLTNVLDGNRYFHVSACNDGGCGPSSDYMIEIDTAPPTAVSGLVGKSSGGNMITLSWQPASSVSGIKEYQGFRSTNQTTVNNRFFLPTDPGVVKFTTNGTTFVDSNGLVPGVAYYYRVLAVDNAGNAGAPSGVRTVRNFTATGAALPGTQQVTDLNQGSSDKNKGQVVVPGLGDINNPGNQNAMNTPGPIATNPISAKTLTVPGMSESVSPSPSQPGGQPLSAETIIIALIIIAAAALLFTPTRKQMLGKGEGRRKRA